MLAVTLSQSQAVGVDGLPQEFFLQTLHVIVSILIDIFNGSLDQAHLPSCWKKQPSLPLTRSPRQGLWTISDQSLC